jgi:hypothetical protein
MNREQWLGTAIQQLHKELFAPLGETLPENLKVSCGFSGGGGDRTTLGACWARKASAANNVEIFISPIVAAADTVLSTLVHEMVHAYRPGAKHGPKFRELALAVGLAGKMTATHAGPELVKTLESVATDLGPYPHAELNIGTRKKQTTRMIKAKCTDSGCGCVFRTSAKWIKVNGHLLCPICCTDCDIS